MTRDYQAEARELLTSRNAFDHRERVDKLAARLQADADALATYHETCRELHAKIRDLESQLAAARDSQLTEYERANLAALVGWIGYPSPMPAIEPFHLANTGDWLGQIYWKLGLQQPTAAAPNVMPEQIRVQVAEWVDAARRERSGGEALEEEGT